VGVVELGPGDLSRWESFVGGRDDALVYHHPAWLESICAANRYRRLVLAHADANGVLDGVLPLVHRRGWITGRRLISLPHTPVAGPLAERGAATTALVEAALVHARNAGARLELKTRAGELDGIAGGVAGTPWSVTFVLSLPEDGAPIRFGSSRNHRRIKWAVGKATREGVEIREADCERDLRNWYRLYLTTMRTLAVPPRPYRYFASLWSQLHPRGLLWLLLAERRGRLLAGSIFLAFGSTVFYAFNGSVREQLSSRPNDLIQWHAIHAAAEAGFRRYDFGEVEPGQCGLAEFKAKWGAKPERLVRYVNPPLRSREALAPVMAVRRVGAGVWKAMPLGATAGIGRVVYRWL
jgi:CelD/BcsL family acetyltransferase involved in cellulose biosynthesis